MFLQQNKTEENAHIMKLKKYHLQLQQECEVCACACMYSVHECVQTML